MQHSSEKPNGLVDTARHLYNTGELSDFTIKCGNDVYKCHKALICPRNQFFTACCTGGFRETDEACVDLKEENPDVIARMMQFFYLGDYEQVELDKQKRSSEDPVIEKSTAGCSKYNPPRPLPSTPIPNPYGLLPYEFSAKKSRKLEDNIDKIQTMEKRIDKRVGRLLRNIEVYHFAQKFSLEPLRGVALERAVTAFKERPCCLLRGEILECIPMIIQLPRTDELRKQFVRLIAKDKPYLVRVSEITDPEWRQEIENSSLSPLGFQRSYTMDKTGILSAVRDALMDSFPQEDEFIEDIFSAVTERMKLFEGTLNTTRAVVSAHSHFHASNGLTCHNHCNVRDGRSGYMEMTANGHPSDADEWTWICAQCRTKIEKLHDRSLEEEMFLMDL